MTLLHLPTSSALATAVQEFNGQFGYELRLPIDRQTVESAATIAEIRGKTVLAQSLRQALGETMEVVK